jgi:hypothetical protein
MNANIFLVDPRLGLEDQLTAFWHYVLNLVPELGQGFMEQVATQAGLSRSRFVGAIDHPMGDRHNHPDLLIQTDKYDVLFEHKVDSPFGPHQATPRETLPAVTAPTIACAPGSTLTCSTRTVCCRAVPFSFAMASSCSLNRRINRVARSTFASLPSNDCSDRTAGEIGAAQFQPLRRHLLGGAPSEGGT